MSIGSLVSSGPLILAVPVAAAAGAVTFLSPCCLPLVPGYLSYVTGMSGAGSAGSGASQAGAEPAAARLASAQAVG
ncbi:MAG: cytochrome c biogenesis protein CcdA, partial [Streptosporangiaceae bacterium]